MDEWRDAPPPGTPPHSGVPELEEEAPGCGALLLGCAGPRTYGCLVGILLIAGILAWLALTGQLS